MAPVIFRSVSSRSRPLLRRALRHNIIVVIIIAMPPLHRFWGGVGRHVPCYVHPKEVISHHSENNTTKSRFIGTSGLGHPSTLNSITPNYEKRDLRRHRNMTLCDYLCTIIWRGGIFTWAVSRF